MMQKALAFTALAAVANAQIPGHFDEYAPEKSLNANPDVVHNLPELDVAREVASADFRMAGTMEKYLDVGKVNNVKADFLSVSAKTRTESGTVFTAAWRVPGALSVAVHLDTFHVPEGGALFVVGDGETLGPFTSENEGPAGNLMISHVKGEQVTLQYYHSDSAAEDPVINVEHVTGAFRDIWNMNSRPCNIQAACAADTTGCNSACSPTNSQCSIQCTYFEQNTSNGKWMDASWGTNQQFSSVALATSSGSRFCSGAFINNPEGKPYVLTAAHCSAGSTTQVIHMFRDGSCQSTSNTGGLPPSSQFMGGAGVIANYAESDITILEMDDARRYTANRIYLSGWDTRAISTTPEAVVAIHHPASSNMKVSHSDQTPTGSRWSGSGPDSHWRVNAWTEATTEGGSSGSPLYDRQTGRIIGQLHGGSAACPALNGWDVYGGLFRSAEMSSPVRDALGGTSSDGTWYAGN